MTIRKSWGQIEGMSMELGFHCREALEPTEDADVENCEVAKREYLSKRANRLDILTAYSAKDSIDEALKEILRAVCPVRSQACALFRVIKIRSSGNQQKKCRIPFQSPRFLAAPLPESFLLV